MVWEDSEGKKLTDIAGAGLDISLLLLWTLGQVSAPRQSKSRRRWGLEPATGATDVACCPVQFLLGVYRHRGFQTGYQANEGELARSLSVLFGFGAEPRCQAIVAVVMISEVICVAVSLAQCLQ